MAEEFVEYLENFVDGIIEAARKVAALLIVIATSPLWGYVFVFWYFFVYNAKENEPKEVNDTWKQHVMNRFERIE